MHSQKLPGSIARLNELAYNLWWSWHEDGRRVFRTLNYPLWTKSVHNPVKVLRESSQDTLLTAASDPDFLDEYNATLAHFDAEMSAPHNWPSDVNGAEHGPVAYFSMEFAIHNSLPIYAGGLGVLAGDICKEASDMGLPMVAIGFMYPQGYFHQHVSGDGWQEEIYHQLDFDEAPIARVLSPKGNPVIAEVELDSATIGIEVWRVRVGRTDIYLLCTNLETNPERYRRLSDRLYVAGREQRLEQEIVLGIGGVRVLRALNIEPAVWHANEGHTAFMMLERIREKVAQGLKFEDALSAVQSNTVFTTHTPVMAGHDIFAPETMDKYFSRYLKSIGVNRETFLQMGRLESSRDFNMTAFAMRSANQRCAVSQVHETVTRKMWHGLWPEEPEDKAPISHVTNGIHHPSWVAPEMDRLFRKYLGQDWTKNQADPKMWECVSSIPNAEFWAVHEGLKRKLVGAMRETARLRWVESDIGVQQVLSNAVLFDSDVLTIGFARRFTEYKRPMLLFRDIERLKNIINNTWQPVQIVFAGKSHPADTASKRLLQEVYHAVINRDFRGRMAFLEDYDIHISRYLVQGVDVWLNTPRRLQEASGTSGMKASLNGVLHLSVPDGWWLEGYNGSNGWSITSDFGPPPSGTAEDDWDSKSIYRLLEEEVVPLYYRRDRNGIPHGWIRMMKEAVFSVAPYFSARRMMNEYMEKMYRVPLERKVGA